MNIKSYSLRENGDIPLTKHFKIREFRCRDGSDLIKIDTDFVQDKLQRIRDWAGAPVILNSAYRTEAYNQKVGGAAHSYHVLGRAFDIRVQGEAKSLDEICRYAESIGVLGIIRYPNHGFVHIDSRTTKYFSKDSGKSSCSTFQ